MEKPPIHCWGVAADLLPLEGGHRNIAFRTLGLRHDFVFKSSRRSPDAVEWLLRVHSLARRSGLVVPRLFRSMSGQLVERGWTCEAFVEGRPFSAADLPSIHSEISCFHMLAADVPQRPGFLSSQALLDAESGGDVDLGAMPSGLVATCRAAWRGLSGLTCTIVHGDLNPGNLLRCPDGKAALLDWDECRRDLAVFDLGLLVPVCPSERRALLAWEAACSWQIEPEHARQVADRL